MNIIGNMFSIPYLQLQIKNWGVKKEILYDLEKEEELYYSLSVMTSYRTNLSDEENEIKNQKFQNLFEDELIALNENFDLNQSYVSYAWFQNQEKFMHHGIHNHGMGEISSVCYIEFDPNLHTPTVFVSPFPDPFTGVYSTFSPQNVKSGTIVFFPSMVLHYTNPNQSDVARKILSMNISVK